MRNKCLLMTIFFNLQKPYWSPCPIVQWRILQQLSFSRFLSVSLFFIAMMKMITMTCKLMSKHLSLDKMLVDRDIKASRDSTPLPTSVTTIFTFLVFCWKTIFLLKLPPFNSCFIHRREARCKTIDCICLPGSNVWQWIQNGKFNLRTPGRIRKRKSFLLLLLLFWAFIDFLLFARCRHRRTGCRQSCLVMTG